MTDPTWINHIADDLAGARIPGGCDDCEAYQQMQSMAPGVVTLGVFHDDDCPTWRRIQDRP